MNGRALMRARLLKGYTLRDVEAETERRGNRVDASNLHRAEQGAKGMIGPRKIPTLLAVLELDIKELIPDEDVA